MSSSSDPDRVLESRRMVTRSILRSGVATVIMVTSDVHRNRRSIQAILRPSTPTMVIVRDDVDVADESEGTDLNTEIQVSSASEGRTESPPNLICPCISCYHNNQLQRLLPPSERAGPSRRERSRSPRYRGRSWSPMLQEPPWNPQTTYQIIMANITRVHGRK